MSTRIAGGMHPIVRRSAAFAIRHIGPPILNYIARKITGEGAYRRKRRCGAGTRLIVHKPRLGMGYRKRRVHRRVRLPMRANASIHRRIPTIKLGMGYRRKRVGRLSLRSIAKHRLSLRSMKHRPRINIRAGAWQLPHYGGRRIVRKPQIRFI